MDGGRVQTNDDTTAVNPRQIPLLGQPIITLLRIIILTAPVTGSIRNVQCLRTKRLAEDWIASAVATAGNYSDRL